MMYRSEDEPLLRALLREVQVLLPKDNPGVGVYHEPEVGLPEDEQEVGQGQGHILDPADPCRSIYI